MARDRIPGPAGVGTDLRAVKAYVPVETWGRVMDTATAAGISVSAYLRLLIERDELDEQGRPVWIDSALHRDSGPEQLELSA